MHVDQPACFLPRLLHPVETEAGVHLVGELTALQPLEGRHGRSIVPGLNTHNSYIKFMGYFCVSTKYRVQYIVAVQSNLK